MTDIAKLVVALEAETAKYRAELNRANDMLKRFSQQQAKTLDQIKFGFQALVGVFGASQIAGWFKGIIEAGDAALQMSQKLGISVETLTGLELGLKQADVSMSQFQTAMQKLARAQVAAIQGSEAQARAFKVLGLSIDNIKAASLEGLLRSIADRFSSLENGAQKAAIAQQLFGKSGTALIPFLNEGSAAFDRYIKQSKALGLIWTQESARAADQFGDSMAVLVAVAKGYGTAIVQDVLPALNSLTQFFINANAEGVKIGPVMSAAIEWFRALASVVVFASASIDNLYDRISTLGEAISKRLVPGTLQWKQQWLEFEQRSSRRALDASVAVDGILNPQGDSATEATKAVQNFAAIINAQAALEQQTKDATAALREEREVMSMFQEITDQNTKFLRDSEAEVQGMFQQLVEHEAANMKQLTEQSKAANKEMTEFAKSAAQNMQSSFADFLFDPFQDGLSGMLQGFLNTIRRMVAELAAQEILTSVFSGFSGSSNGFLKGLSTAFGGARANGGPVSGGMGYLVGERGPEIFVPNVSGAIQTGGGGTNVQIVDQRGAAAPPVDVSRQMVNGLEQIRILIRSEVGGMFADGSMDRNFRAASMPIRRVGSR